MSYTKETKVRLTGRTTAAFLKMIADAMLNRECWIEFKDHINYEILCEGDSEIIESRLNMWIPTIEMIMDGLRIPKDDYELKIFKNKLYLKMKPKGFYVIDISDDENDVAQVKGFDFRSGKIETS